MYGKYIVSNTLPKKRQKNESKQSKQGFDYALGQIFSVSKIRVRKYVVNGSSTKHITTYVSKCIKIDTL